MSIINHQHCMCTNAKFGVHVQCAHITAGATCMQDLHALLSAVFKSYLSSILDGRMEISWQHQEGRLQRSGTKPVQRSLSSSASNNEIGGIQITSPNHSFYKCIMNTQFIVMTSQDTFGLSHNVTNPQLWLVLSQWKPHSHLNVMFHLTSACVPHNNPVLCWTLVLPLIVAKSLCVFVCNQCVSIYMCN